MQAIAGDLHILQSVNLSSVGETPPEAVVLGGLDLLVGGGDVGSGALLSLIVPKKRRTEDFLLDQLTFISYSFLTASAFLWHALFMLGLQGIGSIALAGFEPGFPWV